MALNTETSSQLTIKELEFLAAAAQFFTDPGLIAKGLAWAGRPVESLQDRLPEKARTAIAVMAEKAIERALVAAVKTLPKENAEDVDAAIFRSIDLEEREQQSRLSSRLHRGLTTLTGAAGGLFGLPSLAIELPVTTVLILRAISDQARLYGHDLNDVETRLECLMVFAMGLPSQDKIASGSSSADAGRNQTRDLPGDLAGANGFEGRERESVMRYFMTRASFVGIMRRAIGVAGAFTAKELASSFERGSAPLLAKLAAAVAEKFEIRVSQKFLAESVPLVGAVGGGALNYAFTDFFVTTARYHFGIRALEKKYGEDVIREHFGLE